MYVLILHVLKLHQLKQKLQFVSSVFCTKVYEKVNYAQNGEPCCSV